MDFIAPLVEEKEGELFGGQTDNPRFLASCGKSKGASYTFAAVEREAE